MESAAASSVVMWPTPTVRFFTEVSVSSVFMICVYSPLIPSSTETISAIWLASMSRTTPPTFTTDRMTRPPVVFSNRSSTRSRKRQQCMNIDSKPKASAARPSHKRCEWIRDSSCQMTRKYSARFGTSTPMSDSTVSA